MPNIWVQSVMVGRKELFLVVKQNIEVAVFCLCSALNRTVKVSLTVEQAEEIFCHERAKRRQIRDIIPDVPPQIQEIFISGTTPAEWDKNVIGRKIQSNEHYSALGYILKDE